MSTSPSILSSHRPNRPWGRSILRIIAISVSWLIMPSILFIASGRFDWVMGYVYIGMLIITGVASRLLIARVHPDLLAERARFTRHENVKAWDRAFVLWSVVIIPLIAWIVAGLDKRFGWSPSLDWVVPAFALIVTLACYLFSTWAVLTNRFFSSVVRIQTDRGHTVVSDGPYRIVRHPAYIASIVSWLAMPFLLGTLWALIPVGIICVLSVIRTALEDRTLQAELPGYAQYTQRTRYRLLPGIW